jgi:formiminotetrahydrofolate cyclodeaminase
VGDIIAILGCALAILIYQIGVNKENDRRMDGLRLDLNELRGDIKTYIHNSHTNQELLEERFNAIKSNIHANLMIIEDKVNRTEARVNDFLKS